MTGILEDLNRLKTQYQNMLLALPNVVGVGIGYKKSGGKTLDELSLVTMVRTKLPQQALQQDSVIPSELGGARTDVIEVGKLRAMQSMREHWRPAIGGISIGHYHVTAGTLGCIVYDSLYHTHCILSNNHVLANSNACSLGDPILQQGRVDGGILGRDTLAVLSRFVPLQFLNTSSFKPLPNFIARFGIKLSNMLNNAALKEYFSQRFPQINQVDAALGKPLDSSLVAEDVFGIGIPTGTQNASLGMAVRKTGRSTGLTSGEIEVVSATVIVSYGDSKTARFENQLITSAMCQGGDSGSILFTSNSTRVVGLLFGGSSLVTIYNPISSVSSALKISLASPCV